MKNLDQIRAQNALCHKDLIAASQGGGDAISGFPMLIKTDGLLASLAFACERKSTQGNTLKHPGEYTIATAIAYHLRHEQIAISTAADADALINSLASANTDVSLRRATAEALSFLNYLKRFVA